MRILLLLSGHLTSCPRAVKFADTLSEAGHDVQVLSCPVLADLAIVDQSVALGRTWRHHACPLEHRLIDRLCARISLLAARIGLSTKRLLRWTGGGNVGRLRRAVRSHLPVDQVIAFNLPALAVAMDLHESHRIPYHFDAEDDHVELLPDRPEHRHERNRRRALIKQGTATAASLSAAAPLMANALAAAYDRPFTVLLNAFAPLAVARKPITEDRVIELIWHSQVIGPGRGLEAFLPILSLLPNSRLWLRGRSQPEFLSQLENIVAALGIAADRLRILPPVPAHTLIQSLDAFDIGLALELPLTANLQNCLSNKIFEYLASGMPIILSDTPAQRALCLELGDAAVLIDLDLPQSSAQQIEAWLRRQVLTGRASAVASALAESRFNWNIEAQKLLQLLHHDHASSVS